MKSKITPLVVLLCSLVGAALAGPVTDIRQGLVAYWPMDETPDGIITPDATPFGNHLTLVGMSAANFVVGQRGNAASLNGSSTYMTNLHGPDNAVSGLPIVRAGSRTIMMWVKAPPQTSKYLISEGNTNTATPIYILQSGPATNNTKFDVIIRNDGNTTLLNHPQSTNVVFDDAWHHVALVDDLGSVKIYIDGNLDPVSFNYTPAGVFTVNTLTIGSLVRTTVATGNILNGLIDEVALWERALTQAEVQDIMNNGIVTPIPELPPVIVTEPVNQTVVLGDHATFSARAIGNRPLSYQWLSNGVDNVGGNSATYTALHVTSPAQYSVRVSNSGGDVTSSNATVTVLPDPPANLASNIISYWPFDMVDEILNTTPDVYSHNDMQLVNMTSAQLVPGYNVVSNALSFTAASSQYTLRTTGFPLYNNPAYTVSMWVKGNGAGQNDLRVFAEGSSAGNTPLFTLGTRNNADGSTLRPFIRNDANAGLLNGPISARPVFDDQWHHIVWSDSNGVARLYIDGTLDTTNFRYTRTGTLTLDRTAVGAIVRAAAGNYFTGLIDEVATWSRALTFTEVQSIYTNGVPLPVSALPVTITKQPVGRDVFAGEMVQLSVETTGTSPIQYQWQKENIDIDDETNSTLIFASVQTSDVGSYRVRVSNSVNATNSVAVSVVVHPLENILSGLVAHWPLDMVDGTTTPDISTNGNHLTLLNMDASNIVGGNYSNAFQFNGTDEVCVRYTTNSIGLPLYSNLSFSVSLWVNGIGSSQSDRRVFSEGSTTNNSALFNIGTDSAAAGSGTAVADLYVRNADGSIPVNHRKTAQSAFDGTWHNIIYVDNNGAASVYVDGVLDSTSFNYVRGALFPDTLSIGGIVRALPSSFYNGMIDDVAVWRRALSPTEVQYVKDNGPNVDPIRLLSINVNGNDVSLTVYVPDLNASDRLKQSPDITLPTDQWTDVASFTFDPPVGNTVVIHLTKDSSSQQFYRVYFCP